MLKDGLTVRRSGTLIFVCGGNDPSHMRTSFREIATEKLKDFQVFQPEFAMKDYFSDAEGSQMDLGAFEKLIGELSHAIVIFPEAAGSFAETGYFANIDQLAEKVILVLNMNYQGNDSFIMMGPARKYETLSKFSPNIQMDYKNPELQVVIDRINRVSFPKTRKFLDVSDLNSPYDLFCLIYKVFEILSVATIDDVNFVLNSITKGHSPVKRVRELSSILAGAGYIK